jgi:hypothetical protein
MTYDFNHRTGSEWICGLDLKRGYGGDPAAEDIIDAPCWIPTGSKKMIESHGTKHIFRHSFRPGIWGSGKYD